MVAKIVRRYQKEIIAALILLFLFALTRLINLTAIPIFVDEAIYVRWAQIAKNDSNWRFISLTDGKQPLFVWSAMIVMKLFSDPLWAGRATSAAAGLVSMVGLWWLSFELFKNRRLAFLSAFLYLVVPFYLVHDRMALMDSMVGAFSVWSLLLAILLVKSLRLDIALILGAVLGGAVLTKTSGFFGLYLLPLTLLLFDWSKKERRRRLLRWLGLVFLAAAISQLLYSVLRLSPFFHIIAEKNTLFVYPLSEWLEHPISYLRSNLRGLLDWLVGYLTWPLVALIALSMLFLKKDWKQKVLLFLWFLVPFAGLSVFGKTLYARFILFMTLPLLVIAAHLMDRMIDKVKSKIFLTVIFSVLLGLALYTDALLLANPSRAPIPKHDLTQYITDWPVGYGVNEIVHFIEARSVDGPVFLATEGTFGLMPASLEIYLWDNPNVEIKGYWPVVEVPEEVIQKAQEKTSFFVFNETPEVPEVWPLRLVAEYPRPNKRYSMRLYQVVPPSKP